MFFTFTFVQMRIISPLHFAYYLAGTTKAGPTVKQDNTSDDIRSTIILHIRSQAQFSNFTGGFASFRFEINLLIMSKKVNNISIGSVT